MSLTRHILNLTAPDGASWSGKWQRLKREFYNFNPKICSCCGNKKKIHVHHKKPRHLFPELALEMSNLIALCKDCHIRIGHLNNYHWYNAAIEKVCKHVKEYSILRKSRVA